MATKACMGVVQADSQTIVELFSWGTAGESNQIDVSVMGTCNRATLAGPVGVTFSGSAYYVQGDAGQTLINEGDTVSLNIYPFGNTTGLPRWTMSGDVTRRNDTAEVDGAVQFTFEITADENGIDRSGVVP